MKFETLLQKLRSIAEQLSAKKNNYQLRMLQQELRAIIQLLESEGILF
jgi:hypothetical protein